MKDSRIEIPTFDELMNPTLNALKALGGSGTSDEIYRKVTELVAFSTEQLARLHDPEKGEQTQIEYRLAWSRTYLKKYGLLHNPTRGVWALTALGKQINQIDPATVKRSVKEATKRRDDSPPTALTSEVVEQTLEERSGVEYEKEDPKDEIQEVQPFDPTLIRIDSRLMTVDLVMRRIENEEINLTPDFQRMGGIWNDVAQSRLIESLLLRIPLPAFYMDASDDEQWLVIDGLQRLTALRRFMLAKTLKLQKLEFWGKEYNGKGFDELPRAMQRRIEESQLTVYIMQRGTPPKVKFNIFKRINTGGVPLSGQEIRHALNLGPATKLLQELAASPEFQRATASSVSPMRMTDRECVLRFLAFKLKSPTEYTSRDDLDSFLNERMQEINQRGKADPAYLTELCKAFKRAMTIAADLFGNQAFRKITGNRRQPVSKALFEIWAVNLDKLMDREVSRLQERETQLRTKFKALMDDNDFMIAISYSTGDPRRVRYRFKKIEEIIQETLHA
jgi:hypothetical protein